MTEIIIPNQKNNKKYDSPDTPKDCSDFVPLKDGTIRGDRKYCDLSFACKQIGMYAEFVEMTDKDGNIVLRDYLCTGCYPIFKERNRDDKAS